MHTSEHKMAESLLCSCQRVTELHAPASNYAQIMLTWREIVKGMP